MSPLFCIACNRRTPRNFADESLYAGIYCERCALEWGRTPRRKETPVGGISLGIEVKRCDECDRVEVVRCKDCTSYSDGGKCRKCNLWRDPEDFCSRGEKKEAET